MAVNTGGLEPVIQAAATRRHAHAQYLQPDRFVLCTHQAGGDRSTYSVVQLPWKAFALGIFAARDLDPVTGTNNLAHTRHVRTGLVLRLSGCRGRDSDGGL